jgi:hypothetical protein
MEVSTVTALLTINLIILSIVIILIIVVGIILVVKLNQVAQNVKQATANVAHITDWFSPFKLFSQFAKAVARYKKR